MDEPLQTSTPTRIRSLPTNGIVALALLILVALLWLPFGFNVGFVGDGWVYFHHSDRGSPMSEASPTRLLLPIPWIIAYGIDPGHFAGTNLAVALLIFGKGWLVYLILRRLKAPTAFAFAAAVLALLLPIDTGVMYLGALAIHFAVFCYLLAFYLLIVYWKRPRLSVLIGMWMALYGTIATYELVYPLVLFSPLVLLLLQRKITRRVIRVSLIWYLLPILNAIFYLFIVTQFPASMAYQSGLIERPTIPMMVVSLINIYVRHFLTGWLPSVAALNLTYVILSVIAGGVVFALCWWLRGRESPAQPSRLPLILAASGVAIIALGVALYLPTALRDTTLRTYYYSMIGAALTLTALLWWAGRRRLIFAVLVGILASLSTLGLLNQHQAYADESKHQQTLLAQIGTLLPEPKPGTGIIVVDETPDRSFRQAFRGDFFYEYTLPVLYRDYSLETEICSPDEFGSAESNRCRFTADGIVISSIRSRYFSYSYDNLVLVRYDGKFTVLQDISALTGKVEATYQPEQRYQPDGSPPARIVDLFGFSAPPKD